MKDMRRFVQQPRAGKRKAEDWKRSRCRRHRSKINPLPSLVLLFTMCTFLAGVTANCMELDESQETSLTQTIHQQSSEKEGEPPLSVESGGVQSDAEEDWKLILVNRNHPLPQDYSIETATLDNGQQVDKRIYPALQQMFDAMRAQGIYPVVVSGFRTQEEQQQIMEEKIQQFQTQGYCSVQAEEMAQEWVALPGTSEHQLGLAVDINADGIHSTGQQVYDWLSEYAHCYGFIKRYPEDKTQITGISNEPWHYRFVGIDAALEIKEKGLCLEEYAKAA